MRIVYLYAELMPYQIIVFKELVRIYSAEIFAVHWDTKKLTPYKTPVVDGVTYIPRSDFLNKNQLYEFVNSLKPDLIYCSGWTDLMYLYVAKKMKRKGIPVVAGSDTQWRGGKQWINVLLSRVRHKQWFSHIWVAGPYQYEYARKLGFKKTNIIFNSLTADNTLFNTYKKGVEIPHTFTFIGRFNNVKGISILLEAFRCFKTHSDNDWNLICIGNGELKEDIKKHSDIEVLDFMDQEAFSAISSKFGVLVLASTHEPWGVVLHEAACMGLPIISSNVCGANSIFLINGFNGFSFKPNSVHDLTEKMLEISKLSDAQLKDFGRNSFSLSSRITPHIAASSLISVLYK